jgi:hypothetical protein
MSTSQVKRRASDDMLADIRGICREQHRVVAARQFEVVVLRARATAQRLEVEPDHAIAATRV